MSTRYYFGISKKELDKRCLSVIYETKDPDTFYKIRIALLNLQIDKEIEENGVISYRLHKLLTAKNKWEKILYEESRK